MHIFSLCIIDEPSQPPASILVLDHQVMHILSLMTVCYTYLLFTDTQDSLFVTFLCVSLGVTKVVENEYY